MDRYEYMKMALAIIPKEIISQYQILSLASYGWIYMDICKGMPGLKQSGRIVSNRLQLHLAQFGYSPVARTPSLWKHTTKNISFSLVVDNIGVKYVGKENAEYLIKNFKKLYTIFIDWNGACYCRLTLKWNYDQRTCEISMPDYIPAALHKFQNPIPSQPQDSPHYWKKPVYGSTIQWVDNPDDSSILTTKSITLVQKIVGTLLYYAVDADPTRLVALESIAPQKSAENQHTYDEVLWLLNYAAFHQYATIRHSTSEMILHVHSDASYIYAPKACSRAGRYYFLSNRSSNPDRAPHTNTPLNGPIHTVSKIMSNVMSSTA